MTAFPQTSFDENTLDYGFLISELVATINHKRGEILSTTGVLHQPVEYMLASEGKRLRPLLVLCFSNLGDSAFKPNNDEFLAAAAIELLHEASLVHDDILDNSLIRRDRNSVGEEFNVRTATHAGALVTSLSIARLADIDPDVELTLKNSLRALVHAQLMEELPKPSCYKAHQQRSIDIMQGKTGALFMMAIQVGIHLNKKIHGRHIDITLAEQFCAHMSLAFQMRDDVADLENSELIRKPGGNDLLQGNPTWPFLIWAEKVGYEKGWLALESAKNCPDKAHQLQVEITESNAVNEVKQKISEELDASIKALRGLPMGPSRDLIEHLLRKLAL